MLFLMIILVGLLNTSCDKKTQQEAINQLNDYNQTEGGVRDDLPGPFPDIVTYLNQITNPPNSPCQNFGEIDQEQQVETSVSGLVMDSNGNSIEKAEVRISRHAVYTNKDGKFTFTGIAGDRSVVINFYHENYMTSSRIMFAASDSDNFIEQRLPKIDVEVTTQTGGEIRLINSSSALVRTEAKLMKDGQYYQGKVKAALSYLKLNDTKSIMQFLGQFKGEDFNGMEQSFKSYGMINFELKDEQGLKLEIAEGDYAHVSFPENGDTVWKEVIPVFAYDYSCGKWKEEATAYRQSNGSYAATIPHTGVWSLSEPREMAEGTTYSERIIYPDGSPARNVEVYAVGRSSWMATDLTTDQDGYFEIKDMVPGEPWMLKAYTKDGRHDASYQHEMKGMEPGEYRSDR
jgi:hypothetical protein